MLIEIAGATVKHIISLGSKEPETGSKNTDEVSSNKVDEVFKIQVLIVYLRTIPLRKVLCRIQYSVAIMPIPIPIRPV